MFGKRIENLQKILDEDSAALIISPSNRFYLTGFESSDGVLIVTSDNAYLLVDFRYFEIAKKNVGCANVILLEKISVEVKEVLKEENVKTLYCETDYLSVSQFNNYADILSEFTLLKDDLLDKTLNKLRAVKSKNEISLIKKAQSLTDDTFSYIIDRINVGRTEREIALDMEFFMRKNGSEGVSFDFIVVSGKNSSLPHGVPTDKRIQKGDFVTMDFGAVVGGYRSDMTRTVAVGTVNECMKNVYNTVLEAQKVAFDLIKPDVKCLDVDFAARDLINKAGFEGCFGHGLGHSVGIDIHENPSFNTRCETPLKKGMVITVEPGIYLENQFGVRIEDMIVVTDNGYNNITKSSKDLIVL